MGALKMAEPITMQKLIDAGLDADTLEEWVNEDKTVVSRLGMEYASAPMASRLLVENGLLGATPFINKTRMESSSLPDDSYAIVTDSSVSSNNGFYRKDAGQWIYLKWNPLAQVKDKLDLKYVGDELVDFNDYVEEGDYALTSPSAMQTALNSPFVAAGISEADGRWSVLKVYKLSLSVFIQVFYGGGSSGLITSRYGFGDITNLSWAQWQKPVLENNINQYVGAEIGAPKYIPDNTDIMEFASNNEGFFALKSNSSAATMLNCPTNLSSRIEVSKFEGTVATVRQITIWDNAGNIWTRTKGGGLWQNWAKIADHNDLQILSDAINDISANLRQQKSKIDESIDNGQLILKNGLITDKKENLNYAMFIGSSTIYWGHTWGILQDLFATVPNQLLEGKGGEIIEQTSARMGANVLRIKFTGGEIPASGTVPIETNLPAYKQSSLKPFNGTVLGATGTVSYSTSLNSYAFTRTDTASNPTPTTVFHDFIPNFDEKYLQGYLVINVGKNNITNSADTAQYIFDKTVEMVNHMQPVFKRVLVMGNFVDNNMAVGGSEMQRVLECNALLKDKYGDLYIDSQSYLMSDQVWADTGITKTAADATAQSEGRLAISLGMDAMHMSEVVWQALADNVIDPKISSLDWF